MMNDHIFMITRFIPSLYPNPTVNIFWHSKKVHCGFIHFINSWICQAVPSNIIKWRLWSVCQKKIWQFTQGWLSKQRSLFVYKSKSQKKVNHNLEEKSWMIFCDKQDSIMCAKPNTTFQTQPLKIVIYYLKLFWQQPSVYRGTGFVREAKIDKNILLSE